MGTRGDDGDVIAPDALSIVASGTERAPGLKDAVDPMPIAAPAAVVGFEIASAVLFGGGKCAAYNAALWAEDNGFIPGRLWWDDDIFNGSEVGTPSC